MSSVSRDGRLKPASVDPLEEVGLPSKGEKSLNGFAAQERYYSLILCRTRAEPGEDVAHWLERLTIHQDKDNPTVIFQPRRADQERILLALRKLREAILATKRRDGFARAVFVYSIRVGIQLRSMETYHAALLYYVRSLCDASPATSREREECQLYHVLDLACRLRDMQRACAAMDKFGLWSSTVGESLHSIITNNWSRFWYCYHLSTDLQRKLLDNMAETIRDHAFASLQRSYFTVDRPFAERCFGQPVDAVSTKYKLQVEGDTIVLRRHKGR